MAAKKSSSTEPNYWILVLANSDKANKHYNAQVVFDAQLRRKAWGLREGSRNFEGMKKGDVVLFYIASPYCAFAGCAVIDVAPDKFTKAEQRKLLDRQYRRKPVSGARLTKIKRFNVQVPAPLVVPELKFIKNKKNWGMYFQGSSVRTNETDFNAIFSVATMLNPSLKRASKATKRSKPEKRMSSGVMH